MELEASSQGGPAVSRAFFDLRCVAMEQRKRVLQGPTQLATFVGLWFMNVYDLNLVGAPPFSHSAAERGMGEVIMTINNHPIPPFPTKHN